MICVKEIKVVDVPENWMEIHSTKMMNHCFVDGGTKVEPLKVIYELIEGENFVNYNGKEVCIGWSKQVQDLLGLPFSIFRDLSEENRILQANNKSLSLNLTNYPIIVQKLDKIYNMNFWTRLKYLFKGYDFI